MEELLTKYSLNNIIFVSFILGVVFNMLQDIETSIINYLTEKAWLVKDYEKAFYELNKYNPYNLAEPCHKIPNFKYVLLGAIRRHEERLNKKNKFKKLFKKKNIKEND